MQIVDYSNRRAAIVHLLPQVYDISKKAGQPLPNIVLWTHAINKQLVDLSRRWGFVLGEHKYVLGFLFYRFTEDALFIESLCITDGQPITTVLELLIKRFANDELVKGKETFYFSRAIKRESSEEVLATVGLQNETIFDSDGYQRIGSLAKALEALKLRYLR